jgi:hypothetical protein
MEKLHNEHLGKCFEIKELIGEIKKKEISFPTWPGKQAEEIQNRNNQLIKDFTQAIRK